jgi:PadR family transcriptional regulator PadR
METPMKVERELMRGAGPVAVLKLLERQEMYGYELVERLASQSGGVLAMGQSTLYPMLYALEGKGLIKSTWRDGAERPRRYYRLTDKGRKRLATDTEQWQHVIQAMQALGIASASRLAHAGGEA